MTVLSVARRDSARHPHTAILATRPARIGGAIAVAAVLACVAFLSLALGSAELEIANVMAALTAFDGSSGHLIVAELRLPRTLIGLTVGAALGLSGTLMQGVTRNPLAEPGILGINAGAALFVVLAIAILGVSSVAGYVWFALGGAALASLIVYGLGSVGRGGASPVRLALAGAVLAALFSSLAGAVLVLDAQALDQYRFWAAGAIAGRDLTVLRDVAPFLLAGAVIALPAGRQLNALGLGDDVAASLGQRVAIVRSVAAIGVVLLAGGAVAAAGPIVFVGLAVPHAARVLVGPDYRWILGYALLIGPILLLGADIVGRIVVRPAEVQAGIMTALLGAPVFIALVRRSRMAQV